MNEIKCPNCGQVFTVDEAGFAAILSQVRTSEFDREIEKREKELKAHLEKEHSQSIEIEINKIKYSKDKEINDLQQLISALNQQIDNIKSSQDQQIELEISKAIQPKNEAIHKLESDINRLNSELRESVTKQELAVRDAVDEIKSERDIQKVQYEAELKKQRELVEYYKDFKTSLSTKMIGESLEQHCEQEFRKIQGYFPPGRVSFGKDNTVADNSKGDFIYRELDEYGNELLSIMFEMKNEMDTTKSKHKNEHFLKELDKDRNIKKCEYAVLVSMLEADSEYYNQGITIPPDGQYEKMYIVRPQCFLTIISILRNAALNITDYKKRAADLEQQNIDIRNFENQLTDFKDGFLKSYNHAKDNFEKAIKEIDDTIKKLESVKKHLQTAGDKLGTANGKLEKISVKKLAKDSPSLLAITQSEEQ